MKRLKKIMAMLLLMLLVASPVVLAASQPVEVQAAAKTVLKKQILWLRKRQKSSQSVAYN